MADAVDPSLYYAATVPDASLGNEPSVLVATPDPYGGNPILTTMPWGYGHQDAMYGQDPSAVNADAVNTSTADVLRPTSSPDGSPLIDYGQTPYVPPADPVITSGSTDWSLLGDAFKSFSQGIAGVATAFAPLMSGHANLAGAGGGVGGTPGMRVPGNPGPGGRTLASTNQGGGFFGTGAASPAGGMNTGTLILVGLGVVVLFMVMSGGRR
jgi:hypothetical protein